jgi:hypothetical protein
MNRTLETLDSQKSHDLGYEGWSLCIYSETPASLRSVDLMHC